MNIHNPQARLETDSDKRKEYPIHSGVIRYFPDAIAEIARLSFEGNKKHNAGEPLHWARGKSSDELDCLCRHLAECGTVDTDGFFHDVKVAWRALANLQKLLELERGLPISPGSWPAEPMRPGTPEDGGHHASFTTDEDEAPTRRDTYRVVSGVSYRNDEDM
jgi:hypothetical protein